MFDRPSRNNTVLDSLFQSLGSTIFQVEIPVETRLSHEIKHLQVLHSGRPRSVPIDSFRRLTFIEAEAPQLFHDLASQLVMNRLARNIAIPLLLFLTAI